MSKSLLFLRPLVLRSLASGLFLLATVTALPVEAQNRGGHGGGAQASHGSYRGAISRPGGGWRQDGARRQDGDRRYYRGGGRGYNGWGGGYYPGPPIVYGSPFYCPPTLIYNPWGYIDGCF